MTEPVRCALIGAGRIAQTYAQAFATCDDVELVAVVDVNLDAAQKTAAGFGCPTFQTPSQLMAAGPDVDAAVICAPPNTHRDLAIQFVQHGWHVLCEKPFTIDSISARDMIAVARNRDRVLTMASKFRYVTDVIKARELIRSGLLGEVVLWENAFTSRVEMGNRWNADPSVSGGGVLMDNGTHSVDLMRYFLGPLAEVQVVEGKRVQALCVEDTVRIYVRSASGVLGSIDLSWSINKEQDAYLIIHGSLGTLQVGWKESKYRLHNQTGWTVFGQGYDKTQAFRSQLSNFAKAIRGDERLIITAEDALASVQVVEAAYRSLRKPHWTAVRTRKTRRKSVVATNGHR